MKKESIKVVMLPTEKATSLWDCGSDLCFDDKATLESVDSIWRPQYVYIIVSQDVDPIKEGDWCYFPEQVKDNLKIVQIEKFDNSATFVIYGKGRYYDYVNRGRKIIATTDPKLKIADFPELENTAYRSLPKLQQSFLKEYVANSDGEFEVEYERQSNNGEWKDVLLPSEWGDSNPTRLKLNQDNTVNITSVKEKMYSSLDVIRIVNKAINDYEDDKSIVGRKFLLKDDWIKENL